MSNNKITNTLQNYYDQIFQDGKLMNVHIGMWGMSFNLTEEDIKLDNKLPDTIKLGKKMLIKPEVYNKFKNIEQKIRKYLYTNSFDFPLVGQAHFVPKTKYVEVYTQLTRLREEYMQMVDEFVEKYEAYKLEALEYYQQHKDTVNIDDLESAYPSAAHIREKFYMDIVAYEVAFPKEFKEVSLHDAVAREQAEDQAKQAAMANYSAEYNRQIETHMNKVGNFMEEAAATLRSYVVDFCLVALNKINKKEAVSEANINNLLSKVKEFKAMNFVNDKTIEEKLAQVEYLLNGDRNFATDKDALALLKTHLNETVEEAKKVTDVANLAGEYFRKLAV
jgi:hypothetical protein